MRYMVLIEQCEKQLKMEYEVAGIDTAKEKGWVFVGGSSGEISIYDSDLNILNKLGSCEPALR